MTNIAVIALAGAQHLVKPGDKLEVNKLDHDANALFNPEVLLSTDGEKVLFNDGKVDAKLLEQKRGEKLYVIKFKAKSRYRRRTGHRQYVSLVEIISVNGQKVEAKKPAKAQENNRSQEAAQEVKPVKKAATTKKASTAGATKKTSVKSTAKKGAKTK